MPEQVSYEHIGPKVRMLREKKEWSLTDLAHRAGISRSYLAQIEAGESTPTQEKIVQLANALGALPSELLGEKGEESEIPQSLRNFAGQENLGTAEVQMLSQIEYRGKRPNTTAEWRAIYAVIKGMLEE